MTPPRRIEVSIGVLSVDDPTLGRAEIAAAIERAVAAVDFAGAAPRTVPRLTVDGGRRDVGAAVADSVQRGVGP